MINKIGVWSLRMVLAVCLAATAFARDPHGIDLYLFVALLTTFCVFNEKKYE